MKDQFAEKILEALFGERDERSHRQRLQETLVKLRRGVEQRSCRTPNFLVMTRKTAGDVAEALGGGLDGIAPPLDTDPHPSLFGVTLVVKTTVMGAWFVGLVAAYDGRLVMVFDEEGGANVLERP